MLFRSNRWAQVPQQCHGFRLSAQSGAGVKEAEMFFRSERLFLRPGWPEDWQELLAQIADEAVVKNLAKAPWPYSADDARWFAAQEQDKRLPHFFAII